MAGRPLNSASNTGINTGEQQGFQFIEMGLVRYQEALDLQHELHARVKSGAIPGALLLLEHYPVITLGVGAHVENILAPMDTLEKMGVELVRTDRGGDATYHGPGQIVGYPIINLRRMGSDVHAFLRLIESVIIDMLADFGAVGTRNGPAGVWIGDKKVCSIGIAVRGGVTYHGFALNVSPDLRHFALINPCGLKSAQITSLEHIIVPPPDVRTVRDRLGERLIRSFDHPAPPG